MAVNINCHMQMMICSVYLPPNRLVDFGELRQLVKQFPKPFMLLGDFNGHHTMWGCREINPHGKIILRLKPMHFNKPRTIPTLGIRLQPHLEDMEVDLDAISVVRPPECPPWLLQQPNILFNLSDLRKGDTCPLVFQRMLLELFCRFSRHRKVYTDRSKEDKRTAMSYVCDDHEFSCRISNEVSICTTELLAIEAAIEYIWESSDEEFMVITDSLSSLQALKSQKLNNPIVSNILHMCHYLSGHKDIVYCRVPSHIGVQGNEYRADVLAKAALDKTKQFYYIPSLFSVQHLCLP